MVRLRIAPELPSPLRATLAFFAVILLGAFLPRLVGTLHGFDPAGNHGALLWLALTVAPGLAIWPLFFRTATHLPDRGLSLALALGPFLQTYLAFIAAKAGLGFGTPVLAGALFAMVMIGFLSGWTQRRSIGCYLRVSWHRPATVLIVGLLAFGLMASLRIHTPTISFHASAASGPTVQDVAAEKFTDFTILHNLIRTRTLPPEDTWLAGMPLNYYYFGHLVHASTARISGIAPEIAYNLALCATAFLTAVAATGLGMLVGRGRVWAGVLCAFLMMAAGNLDSILQALTLVLGPPEGAFLTELPRSGPWWTAYDFWRPSRAVIHAITEFPAFSFLLGDLHAHMLALPVMLAGTQLVLHTGRLLRSHRSLWNFQVHHWEQALLLSLVLGILSATNSWDALTLAGLCTVIIWFNGPRPNWGTAAEAFLFSALLLVFGAKILFFKYASTFVTPFPPFRLFWDGTFLPQVASSPIGVVPTLARSGLDEYITHWGWLLLPLGSWSLCRARVTPIQQLGFIISSLALLTGLLWPVSGGLVPSVLGASVLLTIGFQIMKPSHRQRRLPEWGAVALTAGIMLLLTEWVYLDDIFVSPIERINTVFKVWYGVWTLAVVLALGAFVRLAFLLRTWPPISRAFIALAFIAPMAIYPLAGWYGRLNLSTPPPAQPRLDMALDGIEYLRRERPDDLRAAAWLRENAIPGKAILEAAGTQYSYHGRMATLSGKPTYAGWLNHSLGWRGESFTPERDRRTSITAAIYTGRDPGETVQLLTEERIGYIVVGELERKSYPRIQEGVLRALGRVAFESSQTTLLEFFPETVDLQAAFQALTAEPESGPDTMPTVDSLLERDYETTTEAPSVGNKALGSEELTTTSQETTRTNLVPFFGE